MQGKEDYLREAFSLARESMRNNIGGPFGAVVVKDGIIVGKGGNEVINLNDPTAHAEIIAIRNSCKNLGTFDLGGAVLFSTCEPCPMCLAAIYWSGITEVYYTLTRHNAGAAGFRDNEIYGELSLPPESRSVVLHKTDLPDAISIFKEWEMKQDKLVY